MVTWHTGDQVCKCRVEWQCATLRKTGRPVQSLLCAHQVEGVLTIIKNLSVTFLTCLATTIPLWKTECSRKVWWRHRWNTRYSIQYSIRKINWSLQHTEIPCTRHWSSSLISGNSVFNWDHAIHLSLQMYLSHGVAFVKSLISNTELSTPWRSCLAATRSSAIASSMILPLQFYFYTRINRTPSDGGGKMNKMACHWKRLSREKYYKKFTKYTKENNTTNH